MACLWLSSLSVTGCSPAHRALAHTNTHYVLHKNGMVVQLDVSSNPILARRKTNLIVHLSADGAASGVSKGTQVWIEESMPDMSMPSSRTVMSHSGSETYEGYVIFPMGGPWVIQVYVNSGNTISAVSFPVQVTE